MNTFPKFTPLGGCYNYNRLKNEGLIGMEEITCTIDDVEVDCETWGGEEPIVYDDYTDPYGGH